MRWITISRIDSKKMKFCDYESRIWILYDLEVILRSFFVEKSDEFRFNFDSKKFDKFYDRCRRSVKNRYYIGRGKWKRNKSFNTRLNDFVGPENDSILEDRKDSLDIRRRRQPRERETYLLITQSEHHPYSIKMTAHWAYVSPVCFRIYMYIYLFYLPFTMQC